MHHEIDPDKIIIKFFSTARQQKNRQNYFSIPKAYINNGYIQIDKEYDIYVVEKEDEKVT